MQKRFLHQKIQMMLTMKITKKNQKAFTLIELLIVISIISILAALITPNLRNRKHEAKRLKAVIQIQLFMQALEKYHLSEGTFPSTGEGLKKLNDGHKKYLSQDIPKDPWNNEYIYLMPGLDNNNYSIISYGQDSTSGGEGWDKDIISHELTELIAH